jgi:hypothetical protein
MRQIREKMYYEKYGNSNVSLLAIGFGKGKEIESVGKEIKEAASKLKYKTLDEHTEKYLVEERKEDQNRVGYKSVTISQRQKELSDNFEKEVNKNKEAFKKRWRER